MSYARFAIDSNVYVFANVNDSISCIVEDQVAASLGLPQTFDARQSLEPGQCEKMMIGHLVFLRSKGVLVPDRAIDALVEEILWRE